jgi:excisionase family DNA binding protein
MQDWMTTVEAGEYLGLTRQTIIQWCKRGVFPGAHLRYGSRKMGWMVPRAAVEELKRGERQGPIPDHIPGQLERDISGDTEGEST